MHVIPVNRKKRLFTFYLALSAEINLVFAGVAMILRPGSAIDSDDVLRIANIQG